MKFILEGISKSSVRMGRLSKAELQLQTPILLLYTKGSSIPHISKEVLDYITTDSVGLSISIENTVNMEKALSAYNQGIGKFSGFDLSKTFTAVTLRDSGEQSQCGYYDKESVSIFTRGGKVKISPRKFIELITVYQPDIFHSLCDGETNIESGDKRILKSVAKSEIFFKECLDLYKNSDYLRNNSLLMASIEGGYNLRSREKTIEYLMEFKDQIGGYFLDGFHLNGKTALEIKIDELKKVVSFCTQLLPCDKPRMMLGAYSPVVVLELIRSGIDIFDNSYVYLATSKNCAITFNFDIDSPDNDIPFDMDLADTKYCDDFEPFLKNCTCLACQKHTRAYTHHLTCTRELLGPILLMIHNTHHYLEFFKSIRHCIRNDTLPRLITLIERQMTKDNILMRKINEIKPPVETKNSRIE